MAGVGDGRLAGVRDAVPVDVEPAPDRPYEGHQIDHLLPQAVPEPERRERPVRERREPLRRLVAPVAVEIDAPTWNPDHVTPPVALAHEELALGPAAVAHDRDRDRRDPVTREPAGHQERARE